MAGCEGVFGVGEDEALIEVSILFSLGWERERKAYCDEVDNPHGHCHDSSGCHNPPKWHAHVILAVIIVVQVPKHRNTHDYHDECQRHKTRSFAQLRHETSEKFVEEWQFRNDEED